MIGKTAERRRVRRIGPFWARARGESEERAGISARGATAVRGRLIRAGLVVEYRLAAGRTAARPAAGIIPSRIRSRLQMIMTVLFRLVEKRTARPQRGGR